mmetsp:Transcript_3612/g.6304  ORF Transcript_3612/g.6304 Transcript_3612/m.6304 type:complete len:155 (+) Transcript_3612:110-574(+)
MRETRSGMVRAVAVVAAMMVGCMPAGSDGGAIAMWGRRKGVTEVSGDVLHLHTGQTNSFCAEISDGSLIAWSYLSRFPGTTNKVAEGLDSNVVSFREALDYSVAQERIRHGLGEVCENSYSSGKHASQCFFSALDSNQSCCPEVRRISILSNPR